MDRASSALRDHVIVCGWGRVGRAIAQHITGAGTRRGGRRPRPRAARRPPAPSRVHGDATDDDVLRAAGIERARALVAALDTDADNLFVTLSGRALRPDLFIVARARAESADASWRAPAPTGSSTRSTSAAHRMAAFALQPHVADFLDVVMHDGSLEFRLEELAVAPGVVAGRSQPARRPHPRPHRRAGARPARRRRALHHQPAAGDRHRAGPRAHRHRHVGAAGGAAATPPGCKARARTTPPLLSPRRRGGAVAELKVEVEPARGRVRRRPAGAHRHPLRPLRRRRPAARLAARWSPATARSCTCRTVRPARRRGRAAGRARHALPHLLDDQADHVGGGDDALRGGRLRAEGPGAAGSSRPSPTCGCYRAGRRSTRRPSRRPSRCASGTCSPTPSGLTYGFHHAHPVDAMYRAGRLRVGHRRRASTSPRAATRGPRCPLLFQPGTRVELRRVHRRARPGRRGGVGPDARPRSSPSGSSSRSA